MEFKNINNLPMPNPKDFNIICRICFSNKHLLSPINQYESKINTIANSQINIHDRLPQQICNSCVQLLLTSFYFNQLILQSDRILQKLVKIKQEPIQSELDVQIDRETRYGFQKHKKDEMKTKTEECTALVTKSERVVAIEVTEQLTAKDETNEKEMKDTNYIVPDDFGISQFSSDVVESNENGIYIKIVPLNYGKTPAEVVKVNKEKYTILNQKILPLSDEEVSLISKSDEGIKRKYKSNEDFSDNEIEGGVKLNQRIQPLSEKDEKIFVSNLRDKQRKPYRRLNTTTLTKILSLNGSYTVCKCLQCDMKFDSKSLLYRHMMAFHKNKNGYECRGCSLTFRTCTEIISHASKCLKVKPGIKYRCRECQMVFYKHSAFKIHVESHKPTLELDSLLKCPVCEYTTIKKSSLNQHIRNKHLSCNDYVCETCGRHFTNHNTFRSHKAAHNAHTKKYKCSFCDYITTNCSSLKSHQRTHTRECRYTCEQCGKSFITNGAWRVHQKRHLGIRDHQCHLCEKNYARKSELLCHIESVHDKLKPYKCTMCESAFYQRSKCVKHMRQVHKITTTIDIPSLKRKKFA